FRPGMKVFQKDLSEVHICIGFRGIPANSPDRYAMLILNTLLGSGVSSRLFQEIREKRGLVYSINSFLSSYADVGSIGIYAGASKDNYREVMDLIVKESCYLRESMTVGEFERTKKQLKGNILLGLESSSARMNNIARQEIYHGRYYSPEEIIRDIEAVKIDDARALSEKTFDKENMAITLLGPAEEPTGT
ncbi:MAG: M16 family metallopeptidase, partial [bacterium]